MELKDTTELMNSTDYKERFKAEYYQLKIRTDKLHYIVNDYYDGDLKFELSCPIDLLEAQLNAMDVYLYLLEQRAKIENINLN